MQAVLIRILLFTAGLALTGHVWAIERIQVGYGSIGGGMWPLVVAQANLLPETVLKPIIFSSRAAPGLTAMVSGDVSFLHVGGTEAINAGLAGADVVILSSLVNRLFFDW